MTTCRRGDVVLVAFQFADGSGWKHRPALVVSSPRYHRGRQEVLVAAVTSNVTRTLFGDHLLTSWKETGLLLPSIVTGILRTIKAAMIHRRLGSVSPSEMVTVDRNLCEMLGLSKKT
jgi:mRNA-degrading endonuclease toxin of MazEF toxin-antitoxin module